MSAHLIDGRTIAARLNTETKARISELPYSPGLGVILVGDDPASHLYVGLKEKACIEAGIAIRKTVLPADTEQTEVIDAVRALNDDEAIDGILIQLPLPAHIDTAAVIDAMSPEKDADGFHPKTVERLLANDPIVVPGLAAGIRMLVESTGEPTEGAVALVIANSEIFYPPVAQQLQAIGIRPHFRKANAADCRETARKADILIVAVGKAGFIGPDDLKAGATVIDVGTNRLSDGSVTGDVAPAAYDLAGHRTPVPGGVGPMTVALLMKNTVDLAVRRRTETS